MFINYLYALTFLFAITPIHAAPVFSTPKTSEAGHVLTETLSGFYETVIDQVVFDASEEILNYIPESISHENAEVCLSVTKSMNRQLAFMRASLLASVNPLVSLDMHRIGLQLDELSAERLTEVITALPRLNEKISHQLGLIINAKQSSDILIHQAALLVGRADAVINVEWKLRQPFQINVVRENQYEQGMDTATESQWLLERLLNIEVDLLNAFNDRIQEVAQLAKDSFTTHTAEVY